MAHHEHHHSEEKKSVNFWAPLILGLVVWLIILVIETNLDEKHDSHAEHQQTEQTEAHHH